MSSAEGFTPVPGDERLTTAMVSDACNAVGLRDQVLPRRLAPVVPGSRSMGRAHTARFAPTLEEDPDDPYGGVIDFIDAITAGQCAVIATGESNDSAFWGELFSAAAMGAGATGIITDGNVRDTGRIAELGFPTFSLSRRPIDFRSRMQVIATGAPVTLLGVRIDPGDIVMADDDGVVVIPRAREDEVLQIARDRAARESTVLTELLAGESLRAVWTRHGIL